jgi:exonuclease VII large subunit
VDNIELRNKVRDNVRCIHTYLDATKVEPLEFIDGIVDDLMGVFNRELRETYTEQAVGNLLREHDERAQKDKQELTNIIQGLQSQIDTLTSRNKALQNALTTDSVKKELERKIAVLQDKNKMLKKIVRASLEDL